MKNISMTKVLVLFLASSMLLGCSSRTSIRSKQANQILDMIIYEQSKEDFSRGNEISISYKETENDITTTKTLYELSEKNNVVHFIDIEKASTETWYYLESGTLYSSYRDENNKIITVIVNNDPEVATASFSNVFISCKLAAIKKIGEVDKPADIKEFIISLDDIDEHKLKMKFQTKKDYNLTGDVTIYEDVKKTEEIKSVKFEYNDSKLTYYKTRENKGVIGEYTVNYTDSVTRDSIK